MPDVKPITLQDVKDASKEAPKTEGTSPTEAGAQDPSAATEKTVEVDYKAELEKYRERWEREKRLRQYERTQNRNRRVEASPMEEVPEPASPATTIPVDELVDSRLERLEKSRVRDEIDDILSEMSEDSYERELVREVYDTEIKPTGFSRKALREDLKKAYLIANQAKIEAYLTETARSRKSRATAQTEAMAAASGSSGREGRAEPVAEGALAGYTQEEQKWLSRVGKSKVDGD